MIVIEKGHEMIQGLVGSRWVPEILFSIEKGCSRYSEIENDIQDISHTELQRKLKMLVEKNVLLKTESSNQTDYHLTMFGDDMVHIFHHFEDLSIKYSQPDLY